MGFPPEALGKSRISPKKDLLEAERERKGWLGLTEGRYRASQGCGKNGKGRAAAARAAPRTTGRVQGRTWFSHQGINIGTLKLSAKKKIVCLSSCRFR